MTRTLLVLSFLAPTLSGASCPSEKECEALWRWRAAEHITVQMSRSDLAAEQTVGYSLEVRGRETLYAYRRGTTHIRLLMVPPIASLYVGLSSSTTCSETGDTEPYLASKIALPIGYLAKAFPKGPDSITDAMTKDITVKPGRMYVDPGNHIEVKRPLMVSVSAAPDLESGSISFSIVEQASSSKSDEPKFLYQGRWVRKLAGSAIPNEELLSSWLVCPWSGAVIDGSKTLGDLRAKSESIER